MNIFNPQNTADGGSINIYKMDAYNSLGKN